MPRTALNAQRTDGAPVMKPDHRDRLQRTAEAIDQVVGEWMKSRSLSAGQQDKLDEALSIARALLVLEKLRAGVTTTIGP